MTTGYVVAIDGGGTKTDALAIALDGTVLRRAQGPGTSPHLIGLDAAVDTMNSLVGEVLGGDLPVHSGIYLSGLDLDQEIEEFRAAIGGQEWTRPSLAVDNDLFALLRAGTASPNAAAVVCGTGINAIGVRADGKTARFLALGPISGDWGGGIGLGEVALWHAARDEDGRGPATSLTAAVAETFGCPTVSDVAVELHLKRLEAAQLGRLSPIVFEHARSGDVVAGDIVDRLADEIAAMAVSCLARLDLTNSAVPIVLGGGIVRGRDARLMERIHARLAERAPLASTVVLDSAPILGAGLLALESAGATPVALDRARAALAE